MMPLDELVYRSFRHVVSVSGYHYRVELYYAQAVGRGERFAPYPADTLFHDFRVSYAHDLAELNDGRKFFYSNNTQTTPKDPAGLQAIVGCGSSLVVQYEGTGVYWIDRLEEGVWALGVAENDGVGWV